MKTVFTLLHVLAAMSVTRPAASAPAPSTDATLDPPPPAIGALRLSQASGMAAEPSAAPAAVPGALTPNAAEHDSSEPAASSASGVPPRATVVHDGQTFALANRAASPNVETDEYVADGETLGNWTQLLTVQRIALPKPATAAEFATYFQTRIRDEKGASFDIVKSGRTASVFAVRFPKSERNDEQVMICLAFPDEAKPTRFNVVQFALKPSRIPLNAAEVRIKSWRDTFLHQTDTLASAGAAEPPANR
ncbi:MAG TPA: hypothetical protein VHE61_17780 [Opitutaceae bacterium]|nr:hypothetical protein [Opitutaceae bacterium]